MPWDEDKASFNFPSPIWERPQTRYGNNRWVAYSPKLERNVILYSDLEYDHWVLVEATPAIKIFCEQPRRVRVQLPSGPVTTIFDMWILWDKQSQEYREIKYQRELLKAIPGSRIYRQIQAQKKWCELDGFTHTVMTDEVIRGNSILLSNWKLILSNLACMQDINLSVHITNVSSLLMGSGSKTVREIENSFPAVDRSLIRASIFTLIHRGSLRAPLDVQPISASTQIEVVL
jgi:hypothetical protein